jgi:hypothetical protein
MRAKPRFIHGRDAGRRANPVWVCASPGCEVHHKGTRDADGKLKGPAACIACGRMSFEYFPSTGEANRWAALRLQEKVGSITGLRRQVRFPLMTIDPNGLRAHVADAVIDFVYFIEGAEILEDAKPSNKPDPLAALKFKWVAAQYGREVRIYAS